VKIYGCSGVIVAGGMNRIASLAMRFTPHLSSHFLLSLGILLGASAGAMAKPAYVASTLNLRAAPGTTSEIVAKIPGGSLIDADNCTSGWCAVTWQGKSGFAIQTSIDMSGRIAQGPSRPPGSPGGPRRPVGPPPGAPVYIDDPDYPMDGPPGPPGPIYYGPGPYYYGGGPYYGRYGWHRHW
jgi:uncharacterized protein YraI